MGFSHCSVLPLPLWVYSHYQPAAPPTVSLCGCSHPLVTHTHVINVRACVCAVLTQAQASVCSLMESDYKAETRDTSSVQPIPCGRPPVYFSLWISFLISPSWFIKMFSGSVKERIDSWKKCMQANVNWVAGLFSASTWKHVGPVLAFTTARIHLLHDACCIVQKCDVRYTFAEEVVSGHVRWLDSPAAKQLLFHLIVMKLDRPWSRSDCARLWRNDSSLLCNL